MLQPIDGGQDKPLHPIAPSTHQPINAWGKTRRTDMDILATVFLSAPRKGPARTARKADGTVDAGYVFYE
jgi:hypothetical protein